MLCTITLGPDGNYLSKFSDDYFTDRYETDWGKAINFDGHAAKPVRDFCQFQCRLLDRRIPSRRFATGRHSEHL